MNRGISIGVDFGGTKILTGAMSENGEILCDPVKVPTGGTDVGTEIIKRLISSIEQTLSRAKVNIDEVNAIGMGVTGPLDIKKGLILECPQLPTLHFFPLRKTIEDHFHRPVYMNNDANCLIFGEALFGSGVGKDNVLGFTLGTGLGCAIILNRKIFVGSTESSGEIWPSPFKDGTIEDYVCGAGVSRMFKDMTGQDKSALDIASLAENGDKDALAIWQKFGEYLSFAISWAVNVIDPEIVILGGSISNAFKFFSGSMEEHFRKHICPVPAQKTRIVCAKLGSNAGVIGAAALAL